MKFKIYREYGALNSPPIFNAVEKGLKKIGFFSVDTGEDISVVWSALWHGRMASNQRIFHYQRSKNNDVLIIEVGNLKRNHTWRICLNNINRQGTFANNRDLDHSRPAKLKLKLLDLKKTNNPDILIATQHGKSLQWQNMPSMEQWLDQTVAQIRKYTDRKIKIRPHPRFPIRPTIANCVIETPCKIPGTYDDYDINYDYHCVINHNSGPGVQAVIQGNPVIVDTTSLAYEVSCAMENIENLSIPDRTDWFVKLSHTEWTVDEISSGIPFERMFKLRT